MADRPRGFAATVDRPGIAHADLAAGVPGWLTALIGAVDADVTPVTPHRGPTTTPAHRPR